MSDNQDTELLKNQSQQIRVGAIIGVGANTEVYSQNCSRKNSFSISNSSEL